MSCHAIDAIKSGDISTLERILNANSNEIHQTDKKGYSLLHHAIELNQPAMVSMVAHRKPALLLEPSFFTEPIVYLPLHLAIVKHHIHIFSLLLTLARDLLYSSSGFWARVKTMMFGQTHNQERFRTQFLETNFYGRLDSPIQTILRRGHPDCISILNEWGYFHGETNPNLYGIVEWAMFFRNVPVLERIMQCCPHIIDTTHYVPYSHFGSWDMDEREIKVCLLLRAVKMSTIIGVSDVLKYDLLPNDLEYIREVRYRIYFSLSLTYRLLFMVPTMDRVEAIGRYNYASMHGKMSCP